MTRRRKALILLCYSPLCFLIGLDNHGTIG
jgi:hypothetical protein